MTSHPANNRLRLLVVEGRGDAYFFSKLLEHLGQQDRFEFVNCEGKQNLAKELTTILNRDDYAQISDIGIVLDNDYPENRQSESAFVAALEAIEIANSNYTENNPRTSAGAAKAGSSAYQDRGYTPYLSTATSFGRR